MLFLTLLIASLLLIATLFIEYQIYQHTTAERLNNRKRIHSWWGIFVLCLIVFYAGNITLALFVLGLSLWAISEFLRLLKHRISLSHTLLTIALIAAYYLATPYLLTLPRYYSVLLLLLPIILMLLSLIIHPKFTTPLVIITAVSSLILIDTFSQQSGLLLLYLISITALNDILQYMTGKLFGKHHFAPTLSPNKTYEGAAGGLLLSSMIGTLTLPFILPINWQIALLIASTLSLCGMLGDLYISYFKRRAQVKHTGNSIPGHGGLLDRIDSLLLTAPLFAVSVLLIQS